MAALLVARVLTDHFEGVTLAESDGRVLSRVTMSWRGGPSRARQGRRYALDDPELSVAFLRRRELVRVAAEHHACALRSPGPSPVRSGVSPGPLTALAPVPQSAAE
jgi:hypothetical protein